MKWIALRMPYTVSALSLILVFAACEGGTGPEPVGPPASLSIISGDEQPGIAGQELPDALVVKVTDANGRALQGQLINFRVTAGGGSVFAGSSITNEEGIARERWTLGTVASDSQRVEARAVDSQTGQAIVFATFRAAARADAPSTLAAVGPTERAAMLGASTGDSLVVKLTDKHGNGISGVVVTWTAVSGGGTLGVRAPTDASGTSKAAWTLGTRVDSAHVVTASAGGLGPIRYTATAQLPSDVAVRKLGDAQAGGPGEPLADSLAVVAQLADGRPVIGAEVEWAVTSGGGSMSPVISRTDNAGRAATMWTLGRSPAQPPGPAYTATARVQGVTGTVAFTASLRPRTPAMIFMTAPTAIAGGTYPGGLAVSIVDTEGRGVPGHRVRWTADYGEVTPVDSITDQNGSARATYVAPTTVPPVVPGGSAFGMEGVSVSVGGLQSRIGFEVRPGPAVRATGLPDTPAFIKLGERFRFDFSAWDQYGNPTRSVTPVSSSTSIVGVEVGCGPTGLCLLVTGKAVGDARIRVGSEAEGDVLEVRVY